MLDHCPNCHLILDRGEPDYFLGGYTINFVVAELLIVAGAGLWIFFSWPDVPWTLITWTLILLMLVVPLAFYPFAKTLWLALDLLVRPVTLGDLEGHGENQEVRPGSGETVDGQVRGSGGGPKIG
jgi:hypothetical protein